MGRARWRSPWHWQAQQLEPPGAAPYRGQQGLIDVLGVQLGDRAYDAVLKMIFILAEGLLLRLRPAVILSECLWLGASATAGILSICESCIRR